MGAAVFRQTQIKPGIAVPLTGLAILLEHDLFRESVFTFRDHALRIR
jgi:hypothetical protein